MIHEMFVAQSGPKGGKRSPAVCQCLPAFSTVTSRLVPIPDLVQTSMGSAANSPMEHDRLDSYFSFTTKLLRHPFSRRSLPPLSEQSFSSSAEAGCGRAWGGASGDFSCNCCCYGGNGHGSSRSTCPFCFISTSTVPTL